MTSTPHFMKDSRKSMGKVKQEIDRINDIIQDVYMFGHFYSPATFREEVYKAMDEKNVSTEFDGLVKKLIEETIEL